MTAKTVMIMGTSSSAGKSLLTAALCRCLARRGFRVAPFKSQNMSNNAAVCQNGGEIGRSQALQALAAGVPPHCDMNPILLKPEGDTRSQVIVNGHPLQTLEADDYFNRRQQLWPHVTAAVDRMRQCYDVIVIEGAGSPAELNLASVEMVNMSVARYCQSPVLLIGDIERGGVFAQLLGTLWLLPPEDRALVAGLIVNKFRGDLSLFDSGVEILQQRGETPVLGVLPWIKQLDLPEEDAVALDAEFDQSTDRRDRLDVAVVRLPHIANFDDFDPLRSDPDVQLRYAHSADQLSQADVIILPGTKNTIGDLQWLSESTIADAIKQRSAEGCTVIGICGGYQMLGRRIFNPDRQEHDVESAEGLALLPIETTFSSDKQTCQSQFEVTDDRIAPGTLGELLTGYEIHCGQSNSDSAWMARQADNSPFPLPQRDGCRSENGLVWGSYLHGLFHNDKFRHAWRNHLLSNRCQRPVATVSEKEQSSSSDRLQQSLDRLADAFETHIDVDQVMKIIFEGSTATEKTHVG